MFFEVKAKKPSMEIAITKCDKKALLNATDWLITKCDQSMLQSAIVVGQENGT